MSRRTAVKVTAAILAGASAGVLFGAGILWAVIELDDGAHDVFGPERPAAVSPAPPPRLHLVR